MLKNLHKCLNLSLLLTLSLAISLLVACASSSLLSEVSVNPPTISPNADGLTDVTRISYRLSRSADLSIYLVNGIKLQGQIESFDQYVVLLRNTVTQMVYKHAISTVVPSRPVNLQAGDHAET